MPRSWLTETIAQVDGLVKQIDELPEEVRKYLLDRLVPEPEPEVKQAKKTTARKIERCEACNYTRRAIHHNNREHADYHEFVLAKKASKKSSKSAQSSSKSPRASGMAAAINRSLTQQRETPKTSTAIDDMTMEIVERCSDCGAVSDDNVHHKRTDPNYHPFVSTAPPAPAPSPANGGAGNGTANSGTQPEGVSTVAHGASGGN